MGIILFCSSPASRFLVSTAIYVLGLAFDWSYLEAKIWNFIAEKEEECKAMRQNQMPPKPIYEIARPIAQCRHRRQKVNAVS